MLPYPSPEQLEEFFQYSMNDSRDYCNNLIARSHQIVTDRHCEAELRSEHPLLQELWDQYQTALILLRDTPRK